MTSSNEAASFSTLNGESGAAIVTALFYVLLIALMSAMLISAYHLRTLTHIRQVDRVHAELLADTGQALAVLSVSQPIDSTIRAFGPIPDVYCSFPEGSVLVHIEDEAGKIDLNRGSINVINLLTDEMQASQVFQLVEDYRDQSRVFVATDELAVAAEQDGVDWVHLDRVFTVHSRIPNIDRTAISSRAEALPLRHIFERALLPTISSPRRVFRLDISVRTSGGLNYGRKTIVRLGRGRLAYRIEGRRLQKPDSVDPNMLQSEICMGFQ